jgi:hypothetical protein
MIESRSKDFIAGDRGALSLNPVDELCFVRASRQHAGLSDQHGRAPLFPNEISRVCDSAFVLNGEREHSARHGWHVASQPSAALSSWCGISATKPLLAP